MGPAELSRFVKVSPSQITHLLNGRVRPNLEEIERFSEAFELQGTERESYILQAHLAHAPQRVRILVEQQAAEIRRLKLELASRSG